MKTFSVKVLETFEVAEQTLVLKLEKPNDFVFTAGEYCVLTVPKLVVEDAKGPNRCMSIASAPSDDHLLFAMRISETGYKQTVVGLKTGDGMIVGAPIGHFTLFPNDARPVVFLTGGIGITPARSILRQANHDRDVREFFLFYSNYRPEDTAFLSEMTDGFPNIHMKGILTMTNMETSRESWEGERGFITAEMLVKYLPDVHTPLYYLVGTPGFTKAMENILAGFGIEKENIKQDPFVGL
jgi:ferredoxin-NADP reductase